MRGGGYNLRYMKKFITPRSFSFWSIVFFVACFAISGGLVFAATTVGTNLSTTGTFTQTVGSATAARFQNAAGTTTVLQVDTTNTRVGVNAGGTVDTTFEVGGTASISGIITLGGTGSTGGQFRPGTDGTTAFRFQNAAGTTTVLTVDTTNTRFLIGKSGSVPLTTLEVGGTASATTMLATTNLVAGGSTASSSTIYSAEFLSTGTTSINFGGSSTTLGTCLQLKNSTGGNVYARINGTSWSITAIKCHQ